MHYVALVISVIALALSVFNSYQSSTQAHKDVSPQQQPSQQHDATHHTAAIESLEQRVSLLEKIQPANTGNAPQHSNETKPEEIQQTVFKDEFIPDQPPINSDYEQRLKTDPQYAANMMAGLRSKVLDINLTAEQRLNAMIQLQFTAGTLADYSAVTDDKQLNHAMMNIADNTTDENIRVKAIEHLTSGALQDSTLTPKFFNLLRNDNNNYVRNLAADAIITMAFNPELSDEGRNNLINDITSIMKNGDESARNILQQRFGSEEQLKAIINDKPNHPML